MKMKQIRAASMQDALQLARRELGEGAVLLDTKNDAASKGIIVTFAIDEPEDRLDLGDATFDSADILPFTPDIPRATTARVELNHPALDIVSEAIRYHSIPQPLADHLLVKAQTARLKADGLMEVAEGALADALASQIRFNAIATAGKPPAKALMLVGPHGAGKSSAVAKLAAELTLHKQRVTLISTDMEKLGATDSLARLSEILKCPFHVAENRAALKTLLGEPDAAAGWVLIDSAGVNIYEFKELKMVGELAGLNGIEPVLTCPAGLDAHEASEMASVFDFLPIERMLVTRLDAVRRLGGIFAALSTGGYALCNGSSAAAPSAACTPLSAAGLARLMLRHARERTTH